LLESDGPSSDNIGLASTDEGIKGKICKSWLRDKKEHRIKKAIASSTFYEVVIPQFELVALHKPDKTVN
jgi:hypothetical protein